MRPSCPVKPADLLTTSLAFWILFFSVKNGSSPKLTFLTESFRPYLLLSTDSTTIILASKAKGDIQFANVTSPGVTVGGQGKEGSRKEG